jgi:hypothetical protein
MTNAGKQMSDVWQPSDYNDVAFGFFDATLPIILLRKSWCMTNA